MAFSQAEGREFQFDHVESIEKVFPEFIQSYELLQSGIGGGGVLSWQIQGIQGSICTNRLVVVLRSDTDAATGIRSRRVTPECGNLPMGWFACNPAACGWGNPAFLSKNDLFELERILVEDPKTDKIDITLSFDSTTISAETFDELLSHTDIPTSTDKLSIIMRRRVEDVGFDEIASGVILSLHYNHIDCKIHSYDQTWFLGKKSQIEKFFTLRKPWYLFLNKSSVLFPAFSAALFLYSGFLLAEEKYYEMILPAICSIALISVSVLTLKQKLFPFVKIYLKERSRTKFGFNEWCALIGALSGFATLIQLLSELFK